MYSHCMRGTEVATAEGQWLLSKLPECSAPKTPDDSPGAHVHSPYIPPTLHISITFVMSLNDITIICFPLLAGKPCTCTGELHQLACAPTGIPPCCSSTAMHRQSHQFHILNSEPVTYITINICWVCLIGFSFNSGEVF